MNGTVSRFASDFELKDGTKLKRRIAADAGFNETCACRDRGSLVFVNPCAGASALWLEAAARAPRSSRPRPAVGRSPARFQCRYRLRAASGLHRQSSRRSNCAISQSPGTKSSSKAPRPRDVSAISSIKTDFTRNSAARTASSLLRSTSNGFANTRRDIATGALRGSVQLAEIEARCAKGALALYSGSDWSARSSRDTRKMSISSRKSCWKISRRKLRPLIRCARCSTRSK